MPDLSTSDAVRERAPAVEPTPAYRQAEAFVGQSLAALTSLSGEITKAQAARKQATEDVARREELTATDLEQSTLGVRRAAADNRAVEATAAGDVTKARAAFAAHNPPLGAARPFLEPGPSVLSEIQSLILGVGMMGLQIQGLASGGGAAIAATVGLRGMMEGWQAGDAERVKRAYTEWKANHEKLLDQYEMARQTLQDVITSGDRTLHEKLLDVSLRGEAMGHRTLAAKARADDANGVLQDLYAMQKHYDQMVLMGQRLQAQVDAQRTRNRQADENERHHRTSEEETARNHRMREAADLKRQQLAKQFTGPVLKMQDQLLNNQQTLDDLNTMEIMVGRLQKAGLQQRTPAAWEAIRASLASKLSDDPEAKEALDWMQRLGTATLAKAEIAAGEPPTVMRLKSVGEPQVAHILTVGPDFWKGFFDRARTGIARRDSVIRKDLQAMSPAALGMLDRPADVVIDPTELE